MEMPAVNRVQAQVLRGAVVLPNPNGTAPGQWIEHGWQVVALFPGPPREMRPMLEAVLAERLAPLAQRRPALSARDQDRGADRVGRRAGRAAGLLAVRRVAAAGLDQHPGRARPDRTALLGPGGARGDAATRPGSRATAEIVAVIGGDVFSTDGRSLEQVVGDLLRRRAWRIATAESCTGGLVASRLTRRCREFRLRGARRRGLQQQGEDRTARRARGHDSRARGGQRAGRRQAMAAGMRTRAGVDVAVGVTGIAGPGGGSEAKPVGTVVVAVASASGVAGSPSLVSRRPGAGEVFSVAGGAEHGPAGARGTLPEGAACREAERRTSMRLFVAVEIDEVVRRKAARCRRRWRPRSGHGRRPAERVVGGPAEPAPHAAVSR